MKQLATMKIYYVYMLRCADGSFYVGITNNLERRVREHEFGVDPGCYTYERRPLQLVHSSDFRNVHDALACEKQLKGWSRAKKRALIANDWTLMHALARRKAATRSAAPPLAAARQRDKLKRSARRDGDAHGPPPAFP